MSNLISHFVEPYSGTCWTLSFDVLNLIFSWNIWQTNMLNLIFQLVEPYCLWKKHHGLMPDGLGISSRTLCRFHDKSSKCIDVHIEVRDSARTGYLVPVRDGPGALPNFREVIRPDSAGKAIKTSTRIWRRRASKWWGDSAISSRRTKTATSVENRHSSFTSRGEYQSLLRFSSFWSWRKDDLSHFSSWQSFASSVTPKSVAKRESGYVADCSLNPPSTKQDRSTDRHSSAGRRLNNFDFSPIGSDVDQFIVYIGA